MCYRIDKLFKIYRFEKHYSSIRVAFDFSCTTSSGLLVKKNKIPKLGFFID